MNVVEGIHRLPFVDIDQNQRESFESLRKYLGLQNNSAFMVAATWGFLHGPQPSDFQRSGKGFVRLETFTATNRLDMLALALGYSAGKTVDDFDGCWRACEGFAREGMTLLREELQKPGAFRQRFAALVLEELGKAESESGAVRTDR
jgi:hypothetical protein